MARTLIGVHFYRLIQHIAGLFGQIASAKGNRRYLIVLLDLRAPTKLEKMEYKTWKRKVLSGATKIFESIILSAN